MVLLLAAALIATPVVATAHATRHAEKHDICISHNSTFDFEGGDLILTHKSRRAKDRVVITEDGELTINGDRVRTEGRERKLLRKFYREASALEEMAEFIAADAEKIAAVSTRYATVQLAAALRSLGEDDDESVAVADDLENDFAQEIAAIEEIGDRIEGQAEKVVAIAEKLQEQIPELAALDWFLDD
jgi:cell division protein FtsL